MGKLKTFLEAMVKSYGLVVKVTDESAHSVTKEDLESIELYTSEAAYKKRIVALWNEQGTEDPDFEPLTDYQDLHHQDDDEVNEFFMYVIWTIHTFPSLTKITTH